MTKTVQSKATVSKEDFEATWKQLIIENTERVAVETNNRLVELEQLILSLADSVEELKAKLDKESEPTYINYVVSAGDNLTSIGKSFGLSWREIYEINKGVVVQNPDLIFPGQILKIPVKE